ncbi:hypothetical protein Avbf_14754 [Armadillidium vulgare]|nr:hypothetical protein Avbf_14754 [Armadillidium vulgare]
MFKVNGQTVAAILGSFKRGFCSEKCETVLLCRAATPSGPYIYNLYSIDRAIREDILYYISTVNLPFTKHKTKQYITLNFWYSYVSNPISSISITKRMLWLAFIAVVAKYSKLARRV